MKPFGPLAAKYFSFLPAGTPWTSNFAQFLIKILWISRSKFPRDGDFQSFTVIHRLSSVSPVEPLYLVLTISSDRYM
jgi:hypothetical protein